MEARLQFTFVALAATQRQFFIGKSCLLLVACQAYQPVIRKGGSRLQNWPSAFKVRVVTELLRRPLYQALFQLSSSGLPSGVLPFNACHIKSKLDLAAFWRRHLSGTPGHAEPPLPIRHNTFFYLEVSRLL